MEWIQELLKRVSPETLLFLILIALSLLSRLVQYVGVFLRKVSNGAKPTPQQEVHGSLREPRARSAEPGQSEPARASTVPENPVPEASTRPNKPLSGRPSLETLAEKMIREIEWAMKEPSSSETPRNAPPPTPPEEAPPKSAPAPVPKPVAAPQPSAVLSRSALPPRRSKGLSVRPVAVPPPPAMTSRAIQTAADGRRLTDSGIEIQEAAVIQEARFEHLAVLRSPEDIQKAILLHEILSPPVSMRPRRFVHSRAS